MFKRISESKGGKIFHFALRQIGYDIPKHMSCIVVKGLGRQKRAILGDAAAVVMLLPRANSTHCILKDRENSESFCRRAKRSFLLATELLMCQYCHIIMCAKNFNLQTNNCSNFTHILKYSQKYIWRGAIGGNILERGLFLTDKNYTR